MCPCGSCTKTSALKLKFVAHLGEVATQTIRHRKKLVGLDVIQVHRLLKNPVRVPEYLLVSEELYTGSGSAPSALPVHQVDLDLEGIGPVQTHFVALEDLPAAAALTDPSWPQRIGSTFAMVGRGIPHIVPRRRSRVPSPAG